MSLLLLFNQLSGGASCPIGTVWASGSWSDTAWECGTWADAAGGGFDPVWAVYCNVILQRGVRHG